jgi:hypothetical protein
MRISETCVVSIYTLRKIEHNLPLIPFVTWTSHFAPVDQAITINADALDNHQLMPIVLAVRLHNERISSHRSCSNWQNLAQDRSFLHRRNR